MAEKKVVKPAPQPQPTKPAPKAPQPQPAKPAGKK
jgi:hypothetical protein